MSTQTMIEGIVAKLPLLPPNVLQAVYEIVSAVPETLEYDPMTKLELALASETALARLWDTPEEDAAWAHLEQLPKVM